MGKKYEENLFYAIITILLFLGSISFIARVIMKVMHGEGTSQYFTGWGYQVSYLGVFSMFFIILIVIFIGYIFKYFYSNEEKDFLKKYGKKK